MALSAFMDELVEEPVPHDLFSWSWQTILASFTREEGPEVWGGVLQYLGWLESLPCQTT